jgi:cytochrome P450
MDISSELKSAPAVGLSSFLPPVLLYHLRYRPLEFLASLSDEHDLARLGWAGNPLYYAATPELVSQLLLDPRRFVKGSLLKKLEIIIGKGLITLNGEPWKDARRRVQKVFHREALLRQHETIVRHTQTMIDRLKASPRQANLDRVMNELTFTIALELFLGADTDMVEDMHGLQEAIDTLNAYAKWRTWSFIPAEWKTRRNEEFRAAMRLLDNVVEKVLHKQLHDSASQRAGSVDVLSQLVGAGFEGQALRDHVMTMMIAGHETTGTTLSFLWAHVARRADVQEKLFEEAQSSGNGAVDMERLTYTEAVWKETLRLYPAVPILDRTAVEETQLGSYRIPRGTNILWSPFILQRSAKYWPHRKDPNEFNPAAFLSDPAPLPGTYIPFGIGPRMCMGKALADLEALTIISMFVKAFQIESLENGPVGMRTLVTLRPAGGVPVKITPRRHPEAAARCPYHQGAMSLNQSILPPIEATSPVSSNPPLLPADLIGLGSVSSSTAAYPSACPMSALWSQQ